MAMRLSDIAKMAGVSKATVSRAFSRPEIVQKETLERVMRIAKMYNYHPNTMAQAVARQHSGLVGYLLIHKSRPFFGSQFYGPALDGFTERAKARGYHVVLSATTRREDTFEESFIKDSIDGAVLVSREPEPLVKVFKNRGIPVVVLNDEAGVDNVGCVVGDDYGGIRKIMDHLINDKGYQTLAFCSNRLSHYYNTNRYFAYVDALNEHGLKPYTNPELPEFDLLEFYEPNVVVLARYGRANIPRFGTPVIFTSTRIEDVEDEMTKLLPLFKKLPQVFVCSTDSIAVGVCEALKNQGIRIPQDVAVTGFDDIEMAARYTPPLTTIRVDPYQLGAQSMDLLLKYINDPASPSERICVPNELIIRQSS